ncbi:MAG: leucine-rich repeat domain-containing protein [Ruminococcaceae bacterium]|nr:leucine-rich repeat domain-containing protein [Oscillospiraceae bacterium]
MGHSKRKLNIRPLILAALALILVLSSIIPAFASEFSGNCGSSIAWGLEGGVLRLTGSGAMPDYAETNMPPWHDYAEDILSVEVGEGITHVGNFAFMGLDKVQSVRLPNTLQTIGSFAFYNCESLELARLGTGVTEIGRSAFERCRSLKAVHLPGSLHTIRSSAFYRCESLLSITVPASVSTLEQKVFTYCKSLRTATILASIGEIPYWTFYGCYELQTVSLSSGITEVGVSAFENCENLQNANYGGTGPQAEQLQQQIQASAPNLDNFNPGQSVINQENTVTSSTVTEENGSTVTKEEILFDGNNGIVETQKVTANGSTTINVNAVLDNPAGWEAVDKQVTNALVGAGRLNKVQVDIYLDDQGIVSGEALARFAGRSVTLTLHTPQGALFHIKGTDLNAADLQEQYNLSYSLKRLTNLNQQQAAAIGPGAAYSLTFHGLIDFKTELVLPLEQPRNIASFLSADTSGAYQVMQRVMIDDLRMAHFFLGYVLENVEYLVGINIQTAAQNKNDVIIPNSGVSGFRPMDFVEKIEYVIMPPTSSWGISIGQLTWIIVGSMVALAVVVGVVVKLTMKRKAKLGYTDGFNDDEADE